MKVLLVWFDVEQCAEWQAGRDSLMITLKVVWCGWNAQAWLKHLDLLSSVFGCLRQDCVSRLIVNRNTQGRKFKKNLHLSVN